MSRRLLLSMKPHYASMVFDGSKTVELRRRIAPSIQDCDVLVYVSSPVQELCGGFRIGRVHSGTPDMIWEEVADRARVTKKDFNRYFDGREVAYALEITNVWKYPTPLSLDILRLSLSDFVVPQSWRYVMNEEYEAFRKLL